MYQQGPHLSAKGLLPAGPEAEITFCCRSGVGAVSHHMPPSVPLGSVSVLGGIAEGSWHRAVTGSVLQGLHLPFLV